MNYDFEIVHKPGNSNIADYMSRQPAKRKEDDQDYNERETESHINMITTQSLPKATSMEEIAQETSKDPALALVKRKLQGELLSSTEKELIKSFDRVTNELSITRQGIMLRGTRKVIPTTLQDKMLTLAHEGYL